MNGNDKLIDWGRRVKVAGFGTIADRDAALIDGGRFGAIEQRDNTGVWHTRRVHPDGRVGDVIPDDALLDLSDTRTVFVLIEMLSCEPLPARARDELARAVEGWTRNEVSRDALAEAVVSAIEAVAASRPAAAASAAG